MAEAKAIEEFGKRAVVLETPMAEGAALSVVGNVRDRSVGADCLEPGAGDVLRTCVSGAVDGLS